MEKALYGWTVVAKGGGQLDSSRDKVIVYKRDCPATGLTADLAPFTHTTKALAIAAGKQGKYAYRRYPTPTSNLLLPGKVVIRFDLFPPKPATQAAHRLQTKEMLDEVNRAINAWYYRKE